MKTFARFLLDRTFLRVFLAAVVIMCLLLTFREAQTFLVCCKRIFAHGHNEKAELREEDVAVILVAAGVSLESLEILARKASRGRGETIFMGQQIPALPMGRLSWCSASSSRWSTRSREICPGTTPSSI